MNELCLYHGKLYWLGAKLSIAKWGKLIRAVELHDVYTKEYMMDAIFKEIVVVDKKDYPEVFL